MKAKEIREKSPAERKKLEEKIRNDLVLARLQLRSAQLADTAKIRTMRKDLARLLTIRQTGEDGKS